MCLDIAIPLVLLDTSAEARLLALFRQNYRRFFHRSRVHSPTSLTRMGSVWHTFDGWML